MHIVVLKDKLILPSLFRSCFMHRWFAPCSLTVAVTLVAGNFIPARALVARMPSTPEKVVMADSIVVGKIVAIEDKEIGAGQYPGGPVRVHYKVVSLKIEETLRGTKGLTHVRVGFVPMPKVDGGPGRPVGPIRRPGMNPELKVGQEGCFFLARHHEADFYIVPQFAAHFDKNA